MAATFPQSANVVSGRSDIKQLLVEQKITNELLVRVVNLLADLNGPAVPVVINGRTWMPEDVSADLDVMRNDVTFGG